MRPSERHAAIVILSFTLLLAAPGARAQAVNQILAVAPAQAAAGAAGLVVTFTLDTDFPPPPPPGDGPQSVRIGGIAGTSITHLRNDTVTAVFAIPAGVPAGAKDVTISFAIPGGTLVMSRAGGFSVTGADEYTIERTLADGAQLNTIAFDGLAFLTGNLGGQSFLPPGKVADYSGFQYLRDNDPTELGHNTDFVTIVAFNVLHLLDAAQVAALVERAQSQVARINEFAWARFPLLDAFRRQLDGDVPPGSAGLSPSAVAGCTGDLYRIDGEISYDRARLLGGIVRSLAPAQRAALDSLESLNGVGHWDATLADPLRDLYLDHDVNVAVMTYASEMYAWYAGSLDADVYFCPERQATYFGSFYLKDWPAMGNPNYTIDEQLTASAGERFLTILTPAQAALVSGLVDEQRAELYAIVDARRAIAAELRRFQSEAAIDSAAVMALSADYGGLDGRLSWRCALRFAQVAAGLSAGQRAQLTALADSLGYVPAGGAFLYSAPVPMPVIPDTDALFAITAAGAGDGLPSATLPTLQAAPNPGNPLCAFTFELPQAAHVRLALHDTRGHLVQVLVEAELAAGGHVATWDGRDAAGRAAASGTYVARLETPAGPVTRKVTLAR